MNFAHKHNIEIKQATMKCECGFEIVGQKRDVNSRMKLHLKKCKSKISLLKQVEDELNMQFDKSCPLVPGEKTILTDIDEAVDELKKYYDFWESQCPDNKVLSLDPLTNMKLYICEMKMLGIYKELERNEILEYYKEKFNKK